MAAQGDTTALVQEQWRHALAVIAQYEALNAGYGQKTETFEAQSPQGYTLDDLDATYRSQPKWQAVYTRLKALENEDGTMGRVKEIAGDLSPMVAQDMSKYLAQHPAKAPIAEADTAAPMPDSIPVVDVPAEPAPVQTGAGGKWHTLFDILLALLALGALAMAWLTRRELNNLRRTVSSDLEATNQNMQQLANDVSDHVKILMRRVGDIEANQRVRQSRVVERQEPAPQHREAQNQPVTHTYYLSKPDENDCFQRASDEFELGNSLFVLTTTDGVHGTYQVIDNRDVHRFALMMPTENLTRACSGNAIQMSAGMTRIITDRPGEAQLDNGMWRVIVKAIIHYEA